MVLNTGPLDWESSALTTRPLLHKCTSHLFIAKLQASYHICPKEILRPDETIVLLNFADNHTKLTLVQVACLPHPIVIYNMEEQLEESSFCAVFDNSNQLDVSIESFIKWSIKSKPIFLPQ